MFRKPYRSGSIFCYFGLLFQYILCWMTDSIRDRSLKKNTCTVFSVDVLTLKLSVSLSLTTYCLSLSQSHTHTASHMLTWLQQAKVQKSWRWRTPGFNLEWQAYGSFGPYLSNLMGQFDSFWVMSREKNWKFDFQNVLNGVAFWTLQLQAQY